MCDCASLCALPPDVGARKPCRSYLGSHSILPRILNPFNPLSTKTPRALRARANPGEIPVESDPRSTRHGIGDPAVNGVATPDRQDNLRFLELEREAEENEGLTGSTERGDSVLKKGSKEADRGEDGEVAERSGPKGRRQVVRRSSLLAKQVISIRSARSLGFVSQLWVDTRTWVVVLLEVRPNLLSGEVDKFHLEDAAKVGDVVLVHDESVIENNKARSINLDTLVGYKVVTSGRRNLGKVRGYNFDVNSGAVDLLELDSLGISVIPASLVSTYGLFVQDVVEVVADIVVVSEDAVDRVQRLTKGFFDTSSPHFDGDGLGDHSEFGRQKPPWIHRGMQQRTFGGKKVPHNMWKLVDEDVDDWELPMDY